MDVDAYRAEAETFVSEIDREYYLHFAGLKEAFEIEPIYERHSGLFEGEAVERLRETGVRELLQFAAEGLIGQATKREAAEVAGREAALEVEVDGERLPFRQAAVIQANEPDPDRRAAIGAARDELTESELNPLLQTAHERTQELARELGWSGVTEMCGQLSGVDLPKLRDQTAAFLRATEDAYEPMLEPSLQAELGIDFAALRRTDLPALFRCRSLDPVYPAERLLDSLGETLTALGIELERQANVIVDAEDRPQKSPRAFCSPVRVPDEVYLVIARIGGREDYDALFHEAGHAEHYAHVDSSLPFEDRYLGDNSVTEGFAFLFGGLTEDEEWLRRRLRAADPERAAAQARAIKLFFLRRYSAKLDYEIELQSGSAPLAEMPDAYARRLTEAAHVEWPRATWLSDVDPFFYAARYLRAWALETHLRRELRERFGAAWFDEQAAGAFLVELWRRGQSSDADSLLAELTGAELDFSAMLADLGL